MKWWFSSSKKKKTKIQKQKKKIFFSFLLFNMNVFDWKDIIYNNNASVNSKSKVFLLFS